MLTCQVDAHYLHTKLESSLSKQTDRPKLKKTRMQNCVHVASNNRKELQCQGYHFIDNATNGLDFGANKHGINGCTLGEVLHQLQKGWITVTLDEFYKVVLTKSPRNLLMSLPDRFLVCYLIRVTMTIPKSSFHSPFPLFPNCRGTSPWVCFYYLLLAFTQRPAGPRIHLIATLLAGPNLLILKT
jgi:hypothetical protein